MQVQPSDLWIRNHWGISETDPLWETSWSRPLLIFQAKTPFRMCRMSVAKIKKVSQSLNYKVYHLSVCFERNYYHYSLHSVYFEIYGCQMNVNDADIIWSVLRSHGYKHTQCLDDADIVLLVTCSIRDNAEQKVWNKLENLNGIRNKRRRMTGLSMKIGLLGKLNW